MSALNQLLFVPGLSAGGVSYYLDRVNGSDSNDGLSQDSAFQTLSTALTAIGSQTATLYIHAPETAPVLGNATISNAGSILYLPFPGDSEWHFDRAVKYTSGWTAEGGGIYSRSQPGAILMIVETLTDASRTLDDGTEIELQLTENTGTPTTPAEGEYGLSGGLLYVHLPGGVDPNSHRIARGQVSTNLEVTAGNHEFRNAIFSYAATDNLKLTSGTVTLRGCRSRFARVLNNSGTLRAYDSIVYGASDGFSCGSTGIALQRCEMAWCSDEGLGLHGGSCSVIDCIAHHNDHSGLSAVNDAVIAFSGGESYNNGQNPGAAFEGGNGIALNGTVSGTIDNMNLHDNVDSGFWCGSTGTVTLTNVTSGVANGNGDADVACP